MNDPTRRRPLVAYVLAVAAAAFALMWWLIAAGQHSLLPGDNRIAFCLFVTMLVLGETQPKLWMRFGDEGEVTPGWAFAYALVLLGSPLSAILAMVLASVFIDIRNHNRGLLKIAFNVSQITVSVAFGTLVLHAFGASGGIAGLGELPMRTGIGVVAGGVATFVINCVLTAIVLCLHQGITLTALLKASFVTSMAVDGSLLALAPVFVIAVDVSILMLPLLGITSFLVYHSARTALRREHEANHDPLTLLLNRRAFDDRLDHALESPSTGQHHVVLVMDLDRFKDINDRLGHLVGDRLLRSFAERLERALPAAASSSRLGGDEFAVVIPDAVSIDEVATLVNRLHTQLSQPHDISGFPLSASVSIGVAMTPQHGKSSQTLMAAADLAMYRAKQFGSGIEFASESDSPQDIGRVSLLTDLSAAIGTPQLFPHYQPLVRLDTGRIESVEALIRWNHPVYGDVPPGEFIGMAEQTDLIGPITESMFRMTIAEMLSLGPDMPRLSVNVAASNLLDRQFASTVLRIVNQMQFPAHMLEIEITERDILTNSDRGSIALDRLRAHGIRIAIDDFGTGYSSFLSLRDLNADRLKIDQQFTSQIIGSPADELIVTKVIEIAHTLGLDVVAEGVESASVWGRLSQLGCDVAQGYAIARPMPLEALREWIDARKPTAGEPFDTHADVVAQHRELADRHAVEALAS